MTTDIELWGSRTGASQTMQEVARAIQANSTMDIGEIDPAIRQIMENLLGAETEDAIFAAANAGTTATKNFLDRPFLLRGDDIVWKESAEIYRSGKGFPWYALPKVTDLQTGEMLTLNGGGWTFVFCLFRLQQINAFAKYEPHGMPMVLRAKAASSGYSVVLPFKYEMLTVDSAHKAKKTKSQDE
jgi:hypothetical protein